MAKRTIKQRRQFTVAYALRTLTGVAAQLKTLRMHLRDQVAEEQDATEDLALSKSMVKNCDQLFIYTNNADTHIDMAITRLLNMNSALAKNNQAQRERKKEQKKKTEVIKTNYSEGVDKPSD